MPDPSPSERDRIHERDPWPLFQCPACGACATYPPSPVGPSKPSCGRHSATVTMLPLPALSEVLDENEEMRDALKWIAEHPQSCNADEPTLCVDWMARKARAALSPGGGAERPEEET
jgi:hypothetical protein